MKCGWIVRLGFTLCWRYEERGMESGLRGPKGAYLYLLFLYRGHDSIIVRTEKHPTIIRTYDDVLCKGFVTNGRGRDERRYNNLAACLWRWNRNTNQGLAYFCIRTEVSVGKIDPLSTGPPLQAVCVRYR